MWSETVVLASLSINLFLLSFLVLQAILGTRKEARHWDQISELLERLHRKERQRLVADKRPVEPEPQEQPMEVGPPPVVGDNGHLGEDIPLPSMNDENEAMIEHMQGQGLAREEILRRLSQRK